jgi:hypothetical protein
VDHLSTFHSADQTYLQLKLVVPAGQTPSYDWAVYMYVLPSSNNVGRFWLSNPYPHPNGKTEWKSPGISKVHQLQPPGIWISCTALGNTKE